MRAARPSKRRGVAALRRVLGLLAAAAVLCAACGPSGGGARTPGPLATPGSVRAAVPRAPSPAADSASGHGAVPANPGGPALTPQPLASVEALAPAQVAAPPPALGPLAFASPDSGWAGAALPDGTGAILRTTDGGTSWTLQLPTPAAVDSLAFVSATQGWAAAGDTLYGTQDAGQTWQAVYGGTAGAPGLGSLSFPAAADGWAVAVERPSLLHTGDGGRTWSQAEAPCALVAGVSFVDPAQGWLLCAGNGGAGAESKQVYATTDGGATWRAIAADAFGGASYTAASLPDMGYAHGLVFADARRGLILEGGGASGGALLTTADGGRQWAPAALPSWAQVDGASFPTAQRGYAAGGGGGETVLLRTSDGGATWAQVWPALAPTGGGNAFPLLTAVGSGAAAGVGTSLLRSSDAGATWSPAASPGYITSLAGGGGALEAVVQDDRGDLTLQESSAGAWSAAAPPPGVTPQQAALAPDGTAWLLGSPGGLYRRAAGGDSWTPVAGPALDAIAAVSGQELWALASGRLLHWDDGWTAYTAPDGLRFAGVAFADAAHGAALAYDVANCGPPGSCRAVLLVTADGGAHWTEHPLPGVQPLAASGADALALAGPHVILLSTMEGLLRSTDGGASWAYPPSPGL